MKKRIFGRKLSRGGGARKALIRSQIRAMVLYGSITTTKAKVKLIQREIAKIINLSKKGDLSSRRRVLARLGNDRKTTDRIFHHISPIFKNRKGGYLRTINLPKRRGDAAEMVKLEWTEEIGTRIKGKSDKSKKENKKESLKKDKLGKLKNKLIKRN